MSQFDRFEPEENVIEEWLEPITPLTINEFCSRWVPVIYGLTPQSSETKTLYKKLVTISLPESPVTAIEPFKTGDPIPGEYRKIRKNI